MTDQRSNSQCSQQPNIENQQSRSDLQKLSSVSSDQGQIFHASEPHEKVVSLQAETDKTKGQVTQEQKQRLVQQLKAILHDKVQSIKQAKKSIISYKRELKEISEQVDKEMSKSLVKQSRPYVTVNLREIFHSPRASDPELIRLNEQLTNIRSQLHKVKNQLELASNKLNHPLAIASHEKASEIKLRIKQVTKQLQRVSEEKDYVDMELRMLASERQGVTDKDEDIQASKQENSQLVRLIKEEKLALYEIEREDRIVTEKIRYLSDAEELVEVRKQRSLVNDKKRPKDHIERDISRLTEDINTIINKRNKVENQKNALLRSLNSQIGDLKARNWQAIGKLREIDAYLIKRYNAKSKKSKPVIDKSVVIEEPKLASPVIRSVVAPKNDKNIVELVPRKKSYEFGMVPMPGCILLSDQFLGSRMTIIQLSFTYDDELLYGISAKYRNEHGCLVPGLKMRPKIMPKETVSKSLTISSQSKEMINFVQIGSAQNGDFKYIRITTSKEGEFEWGDLTHCQLEEQKNIRNYESITLRAKMHQIMDREAPNYYCLGGLAFSTVHLAPK